MRKSYDERARGLVGSKFRSQGREPALGLDCAGLIIATFELQQSQFRSDYQLRGDHRRELQRAMARNFRRIACPQCRTGDVMLLQVARDQFHLAVKTGGGFVHADAGLRKVVETPGSPKWKIVATYRRRAR